MIRLFFRSVIFTIILVYFLPIRDGEWLLYDVGFRSLLISLVWLPLAIKICERLKLL